MAGKFTSIDDSPLGQLLQRSERMFSRLHAKYSAEFKNNKSPQFKSAANKLQALEKFFTEIRKLLPIFDRGGHPGIRDFLSLRSLKKSWENFPDKLFYTLPCEFYQSLLVVELKAIFLHHYNPSRAYDSTHIREYKEAIKLTVKERFNVLFKNLTLTQNELITSNFEMLINDISFESYTQKGQLDVDECVNCVLASYEGLYLKSVFDKYEIKIDHPLMFDFLTEIILLLEEAPQSLEELLTFLDPKALSIPGFIKRIDNSDSKNNHYHYHFDGKNLDFNRLYEQHFPLVPNYLNQSIMQYFHDEAASQHVQDQNTKANRIQQSIQQENLDAFAHVQEFIKACEALIEKNLSDLYELVDLEESVKQINELEGKLPLLLSQLTLLKEESLNKTVKNIGPATKNTRFIANDPDNKLFGVSTPERYIEGIYQAFSQKLDSIILQLNKKRASTVAKFNDTVVTGRKALFEKHEEQNQTIYEQLTILRKGTEYLEVHSLSELLDELETYENQPLPVDLLHYLPNLAEDIKTKYLPSRELAEQLKNRHKTELRAIAINQESIKKRDEILKSDGLAAFNELLVQKELELQRLKSSFTCKTVSQVENEIALLIPRLREIETKQYKRSETVEGLVNEFKDALTETLNLIRLIEPAYEQATSELTDVDVHPFFQHCNKVLNTFEQRLEQEDKQIALYVLDYLNTHQTDEIPFNAIASLPALKSIKNFIPYLLSILTSSDQYDKWEDYKNKQRQFKKECPELVKRRMEEFKGLLTNFANDVKLNPPFILDPTCTRYRHNKPLLVESINPLAQIDQQIELKINEAGIIALEQSQLVEQLELLKTEWVSSFLKEQEITIVENEIILLKEAIELFKRNQEIHDLITQFNQSEEELTIDERFSLQKQSADFFAASRHNHSQLLQQLQTVCEKQTEYSELKNHVEKLKQSEEFTLSKEWLDSCLTSHYRPLVNDISLEATRVKDEGEKAEQLIADLDNQTSFQSMHLVLTAVHQFQQHFNDLDSRFTLIDNEDTKALLSVTREVMLASRNKIEETQSALVSGLEKQLIDLNSKVAGMQEQLVTLVLSNDRQQLIQSQNSLTQLKGEFAPLPTSFAEFEKDLQSYPTLLERLQHFTTQKTLLHEGLQHKETQLIDLNARVADRKKICDDFSGALDNYLLNRNYPVKDFFFDTDRSERESFIFLTKQFLTTFYETGEHFGLLNYINEVYPGQYLQPLLNRLKLAVEASQKEATETAIQPEQIKAALEKISTQNPDLIDQINNLFAQIQWMKNHGETISQDDSTAGNVAIKLAEELKQRTDEFLVKHQDSLSTQATDFTAFTQFKDSFKVHLHSQDDFMNKHRASWKPILANILIALSTLGIATGIKLLCSKFGAEKRATLFYHNTERMHAVERLDEAVDGIVPPVA